MNEADETGNIPYSEVNRRAAYEAMRIQQNRNLKCQVDMPRNTNEMMRLECLWGFYYEVGSQWKVKEWKKNFNEHYRKCKKSEATFLSPFGSSVYYTGSYCEVD